MSKRLALRKNGVLIFVTDLFRIHIVFFVMGARSYIYTPINRH